MNLRMPRLGLFLGFLLLNALTCLVVFRDALWGKTFPAPLDVAPAAFAKFDFVHRSATGVVANNWLSDQLRYDLPIQCTVFDAYRRAEMPRRNAYTLVGRPLLADAHINGTDPIRILMCHLLPFELACNRTRVLHFFFMGLGVFLLVRHLGRAGGAADCSD